MRNQGRWLQGIQYFRAIAIIEVIVFHVMGVGLGITGRLVWIIIALRAFTSFGVAQFLFISGVVLYNKYSSGFSLSTFYKNRFSAILPPYLVWSTFYFAFYYGVPTVYTYIFPHPTVQGFNQTVVSLTGTYLQALAFGIEHLWFVVIIIQLYLLYPLLVKMYNRATKQNSPIYILSFLLLVQIGYGLLFFKENGVGVIALQPGTSGSGTLLANLVLTYSSFLFYAFYFVFGFFIAEHYGAMKQRIAKISLKSISLVVLVSTIYFAVVYAYVPALLTAPVYRVLYWLTGPFYCLLLIFFYLKLSTSWAEPHGFWLRYLEKIGEDSFGIYLIHWFFIFGFFSPVLFALGFANNLLFYPVLFSLTLVSSYLSVEAIYRLPLSNIIIGKPRKKETTS